MADSRAYTSLIHWISWNVYQATMNTIWSHNKIFPQNEIHAPLNINWGSWTLLHSHGWRLFFSFFQYQSLKFKKAETVNLKIWQFLNSNFNTCLNKIYPHYAGSVSRCCKQLCVRAVHIYVKLNVNSHSNSVNLLYMQILFVIHVWHPHFPLNWIKKFLTPQEQKTNKKERKRGRRGGGG